MFAGFAPTPKVVGFRILKGENLKIPPKSDGKPRKPTHKWKVAVLGAKKKASTASVHSPYGNPLWDIELIVKVPKEGEPLCLLVTDNEDHQVGQVIIPVNQIPPRPANPNERPTDPSKLKVSELEPTKKAPNPVGRLHFWMWVNEYRSEDDKQKSKKGSSRSVLSLSSLKQKHRASAADALNYSGSVLSVSSSNQVELRDKQKRKSLFHRRSQKDVLKSVADFSERPALGTKALVGGASPKMSAQLFDPTYRPMQDSSFDKDGSVLGASSDVMMDSDHQLRSTGRTSALLANSISSPGSEGRSISVRSGGKPVALEHEPKPELLRIKPSSCSTSGGIEATVYATGLTDETMRYASVLVDGFSVPRQDWYLESDPDQPGECKLRINMPERPTGRCYIEVETLSQGRIRCPQEFVYTNEPFTVASGASESNSAAKSSPFVRNSSTRSSSLLIRDRRSTRRYARGGVATAEQTASQVDQPKVITSPAMEHSESRYNPLGDNESTKPSASNMDEPMKPPMDGLNKEKLGKRQPQLSYAMYDSSPEEEEDDEGEDTFPVNDHASHRSAASGQSKNAVDETVKMENESLRAMLEEANRFIESMKLQTVDLERKLSERTADVDRVSTELCALRNRLLHDGMNKYLEKPALRRLF